MLKVNAAGNALVYSTYLGGSLRDACEDLAIDSSGNVYTTGDTESSNFPTANAFQGTNGGTVLLQDAFVTKINAAGNALIFSTYLGGTGGEIGFGIAVDATGVYVSGGTASNTSFPTVNPLQCARTGSGADVFMTKFNPAGWALVYSTYLGGTNDDQARGVGIDSSGNAYIVGRTSSTDFPTLNALQGTFGGETPPLGDAFVTKMSDTVGPNACPSPSPSPSPPPTTVQFSSAATTNIQEDCTSVQLTTTRSGPTTGATAVDYATSDGTAKQKSDYTIALGRLTFAPGETSKTILLLISEDSYAEGNETFTVNLSNATGGSIGTPGAATVQITDDLTEPATNAIDDPAIFVCQQYHDLLLREPEAQGTQFYLNILSGCQSTDAECIRYTRGAVAANFFRSPEMKDKHFYVMYLYMVTLGQRPANDAELADPSKNTFERPHYEEFMADVPSITSPGDRTGADPKKAALTAAFLQRAEIVTKYGSMTDAQFAQALQQTAGVTLADQSVFTGKSRAEILRIVAESAEVNARLYRQAFITLEYFGLLRRDPDLPGYVFHNNRYNQLAPIIGADLAENFIVRGFIESPEYRQRFGL